MKRVFISALITITSILAYCQSNVPVAFDYRCLDRNSEIFLRAVISTFGMDTVKMWINENKKFDCRIKTDSLGYVRKHITMVTRNSDWLGEYKRKILERYLIDNRVRFEFCYASDGWKNLETAVIVTQQDVIKYCENRGYISVRCCFPGVFTRVPLPLPSDYKEYEKLSPFEIFCKRLNIKIDN